MVRWVKLPKTWETVDPEAFVCVLNFSDLAVEERHRVIPPSKHKRGRSELVFECLVQFSAHPELQDLKVLVLADIGCQVLAVGSASLFPKESWVDAPRPLRLLGAGKSLIQGGDKGVHVTLHVPVMGRQGSVVLKCLNVFVHIAEVGPRILIGLPFLFQYRLAFVPTKQFLIPMEDMKFVRASRACQGSRSQNARVIVSILKRTGQPRRVSGRVRFSDPVVTSVWCFVCNPEQPPEDGGHCVHSQAAHITSSMRIACESAVLLISSAALKVRRLSDQGFSPKRATPGSAGYDVRAPQDVVFPAGTVVKVPLDIAVEVPEGSYARLATRSSFAAKRVHIVGGVIDPDCRGNVTAAFENQGDCEFPIRRGDRIAQIVLENIVIVIVVETQELSEASRGAGGFGSTGSGSQDTFLLQENSDNQTHLSDIHTPKHTHIHDTVVRSDFLMNSVIGVLCTLCNLFATKSGSGIPVTGSGIPVSVSPEFGISGTGSGNPESSSLKGIKSGTGSEISVANDPGCGTPGPARGIPGNQPGSGYPELHTVLQPFTGLEVPNNLEQVNTALKESL